MTPAEIEAVLREAFGICEISDAPLDAVQKQILLEAVVRLMSDSESGAIAPPPAETTNPLDDLTPDQRRTLLRYIQEQHQQNRPWKAQLLNDWLQQQDSGDLQFVRDAYGIQWLEGILPSHIAAYMEEGQVQLQVGDRISISNSLWEWVQEDGPCIREWFPCTVIRLSDDPLHPVCTIRFENGMEYEIQGVYDWNRYNWRWEGF
jgi:hypothetical protein